MERRVFEPPEEVEEAKEMMFFDSNEVISCSLYCTYFELLFNSESRSSIITCLHIAIRKEVCSVDHTVST